MHSSENAKEISNQTINGLKDVNESEQASPSIEVIASNQVVMYKKQKEDDKISQFEVLKECQSKKNILNLPLKNSKSSDHNHINKTNGEVLNFEGELPNSISINTVEPVILSRQNIKRKNWIFVLNLTFTLVLIIIVIIIMILSLKNVLNVDVTFKLCQIIYFFILLITIFTEFDNFWEFLKSYMMTVVLVILAGLYLVACLIIHFSIELIKLPNNYF